MLKEELEEIGLSRREAAVYLALLQLGSTKVGPILKKTDIPSSKIYEVIGRLQKKGFVSHIIKGKIKYFLARDPNVIINYFEEKKKKAEELIPRLLLAQGPARHLSAEIFEGQKALFGLLTNLISDAHKNELYLVFSISEENKNKSASMFFKNLALRRKSKRLDVRVLKNISEYKKERHTKLKLRFTKFNFPQGITIFRDKVIIVSWTDTPIAVKIEGNQFTDQFRKFFLELWKEAKA